MYLLLTCKFWNIKNRTRDSSEKYLPLYIMLLVLLLSIPALQMIAALSLKRCPFKPLSFCIRSNIDSYNKLFVL